MKIRDRIKELRRVKASELVPNPKNWRTHPKEQQDALRGLLAEVGYADALLARELPDGGLMLLDGHLRAETAPDQVVPVLILDVDQSEADKILATLDPLAAMAGASTERLDALLHQIDTDSEPLQRMLADLAEEHGLAFTADGSDADDVPLSAEGEEVEVEDLEGLFQILVECDDERQQQELFERLEREGYQCRALTL